VRDHRERGRAMTLAARRGLVRGRGLSRRSTETDARAMAALAMLAAALLGTWPEAGAGEAPAVSGDRIARFESRLEELRARWSVPGMSAAIAAGDRVVWTKGFGLADVRARRAATPETVYHLASVTKPFASVVLLQLVEAGRLDLEAPVTQYGIALDEPGTIRVKHLLGLGWFVQPWQGSVLIWHYGQWTGASALLLKVPDEGLALVLLANADGLSRPFTLGASDVLRSPFARAFLDLVAGPRTSPSR